MSCPEKDDSDSDSTENTFKIGLNLNKKSAKVQTVKPCLKKNSSLDEYAYLAGHNSVSPDSVAKRSSGNKSNRISLKFAEDNDQNIEIKGFSLDCLSLNKRTMSSDMELNSEHGLRNSINKNKQQPRSQMIPYKNSKADIKLDNFILEEVEEEELSVCRTNTEVPKKPSRMRSSSSIFSKLREKIAPEDSD